MTTRPAAGSTSGTSAATKGTSASRPSGVRIVNRSCAAPCTTATAGWGRATIARMQRLAASSTSAGVPAEVDAAADAPAPSQPAPPQSATSEPAPAEAEAEGEAPADAVAPEQTPVASREDIRAEIFNDKINAAADAYLAELRADAMVRQP